MNKKIIDIQDEVSNFMSNEFGYIDKVAYKNETPRPINILNTGPA